ncbi:MAG TPA: response regulator, partial [Thermodesulfobacteriota bacterium]|nr:response regulator [Thermodesulfobacteriota bacterium]
SEDSHISYTVDWASSFEEGLSGLNREVYDVCLLDYRLGKKSGLDLLSELTQKGAQIPIIILTGQGDYDIDLKAMKLGAADYLVKSRLNRDQLDRAIRYAIERRYANEQLRVLASKLIVAQEEERKHIANELHDSLGASLSAVKFNVERALSQLKETSSEISVLLEAVVPIVQDSIDECRRIQQDLRPPMLDNLGILPTFSWFFRTFQSIYTHIRIEREIDVQENEIPQNLKIVIFRILQEAMNNLAKHSRADLVAVSLQNLNTHLELVIRDNGQGFDWQEIQTREGARKGLGLSSMKERAQLSGGSLTMDSAKEKGTTIRASWPFENGRF